MSEFDTAPDAGVRRMNKKPLIILGVAVVAVLLVLIYAINNSAQKSSSKAPEDLPVAKADNSNVALQNAIGKQPKDDYIPPELAPDTPVLHDPAATQPGKTAVTGSAQPQPATVSRAPVSTAPQKIDEAAEERKRVRQQKIAMLQTALGASTAVTNRTTAMAESQPARTGADAAARALDASSMINDRLSSLAKSAQGAAGADSDPNKQQRKEDFYNKPSSDRFGYLVNARQAPLSPYEIKSGTIIPSVLISAVNSDLPGMIIAQVSQNVYDTATGKHLLIPQGSKLVGGYDSQVAYGQNRVLQVWNKLIFPDGSAINLGSMSGADAQGAAGFKDKVNNHYAKVFGSAILVALFSAGIQLSQPTPNNPGGQLTAQQQIAASLGQQMGELGMEIARKNLNIQPTIEIRSGYRFNVMVSKDIVLEPYTEMGAVFPTGKAGGGK